MFTLYLLSSPNNHSLTRSLTEVQTTQSKIRRYVLFIFIIFRIPNPRRFVFGLTFAELDIISHSHTVGVFLLASTTRGFEISELYIQITIYIAPWLRGSYSRRSCAFCIRRAGVRAKVAPLRMVTRSSEVSLPPIVVVYSCLLLHYFSINFVILFVLNWY